MCIEFQKFGLQQYNHPSNKSLRIFEAPPKIVSVFINCNYNFIEDKLIKHSRGAMIRFYTLRSVSLLIPTDTYLLVI